MTIVLDSGVFIAIEKNNRKFKAFVTAALDESATVVVPATVVAETWRGVGSARETGALPAKSESSTVVDANVASIAIAMRPSTIVTSDPDAIERLLQHANVSYAREDASKPKVDVTIMVGLTCGRFGF